MEKNERTFAFTQFEMFDVPNTMWRFNESVMIDKKQADRYDGFLKIAAASGKKAFVKKSLGDCGYLVTFGKDKDFVVWGKDLVRV